MILSPGLVLKKLFLLKANSPAILRFTSKSEKLFQLIDAAVPPQKIDLEFTDKLGEDQIPFAIIFTKADRRKKPIAENIELYKKQLSENWETLPPIFVSSAENRQGKEEILEYLDTILQGE